MYRRLYFISLCVIIFTACGSSSAPKICTQNSECPETAPVCNIETGKCEAATTDDNPDAVPGADEDEKNDSGETVTDTDSGDTDSADTDPSENPDNDDSDTTPEQNDEDADDADTVPDNGDSAEDADHQNNDDDDNSMSAECHSNNDCTEEKPRCISETGKCETAAYGKKACQTDADCTDFFYSKCNTEIHECTSPCGTSNDCRICKEGEQCVDSDVPVCNKTKHLCEAYSDCSVNSAEPCYTTCSGDNDEYFAWLNGELVNKKCKDNTCAVSGKKIGVEPDTCERYTTPPESCNPETSTMLCSPDGQSVWSCDSTDYVYYDYSCDAETEHCVQCQNKAGCISVENCTKDSTKACNSVCNAEGDGYYLWDNNIGVINLHICPKNDCIHVCGTAECKLGTGYHSGDTCEESSFKYCTADGAFAFTCQDGHINQKICKNNDCVYDANSNEIISCTSE